MKFKFIYSKKGYGKTQYILDKISENKNNKILLIVPSHNTFMIENRVIDYLGESILSRVEIMDFKKLTHKFLNIFKGKKQRRISNIGKSLLINYILRGNRDELVYFKKSNNLNLHDGILSTIVDFKNYNIHKGDIENILLKLDVDSELYKKLYDLSLLNEAYEDYLNNKYIDPLDDMKIVNDILSKDRGLYRDYDIYIDGFEIFTYYQYEFLNIILNRVRSITLSLTFDKNSNNIIYDQFRTIRKKIMDILFSKNIYDIEEIYINGVNKDRELKHLDESYLNHSIECYDKEVKNISINKCLNNFNEVEELCRKIRSLVIDRNYRYNEIGVICRDIESYENFIRVSFDEFNIPYFIDKKNTITSNIFSIFLISIFEIYQYDFSYNSLFKYVKSGLLNIDEEDIFLLENFSIENGIKGYKWKSDFDENSCVRYKIDDEDRIEDLERVNEIRRVVINPLVSFFNKIGGNHNVNYFIKELYNFLDGNSIIDNIKNVCNNFNRNNEFIYVKELLQVVNNVFDILDEINNIFKDEILDFEEFYRILIDSISKIEISHIPMRIDEVLIGDIPRVKIGNYKALFVIGCNSSNFPKNYKREELLNDLEKRYISRLGYDFSGTILDKNISEGYLIYSMLNIPHEYLYISYAISNMEGVSLKPSILIHKVKRIFTKIIEENKAIIGNEFSIDKLYSVRGTLNHVINYIYNNRNDVNVYPQLIRDLFKFYYENEDFKGFIDDFIYGFNNNHKKEILSSRINRYIHRKKRFSISSIETYSKCAFKYFLEYVIRMKRRKEYSFDTYEYGNITHFLMENICKGINKSNSLKDLTRDEIGSLVDKYFLELVFSDRKYILNNNFKFNVFGHKIKKVIIDAIFFTGQHLYNSDFTHELYEFRFGDMDNIINISLRDGTKVPFIGRIDRVDLCKYNDEVLINIIDYKSSKHDIEYGRIYRTLNIQTIAYMKYILDIYRNKFDIKINPCGIFYFTIYRPTIKNKNDINLHMELGKRYRYSGIMIDDIEKLKLVDNNLFNSNNLILPIKITKSGELSKQGPLDGVLSENEFDDMLKFVHNSITTLIEKIYEGDISVHPILDSVQDNKCSYCDHMSICGFTRKDNNYDILEKMDKDTFFSLIERGNGK